MLGPYGTYGKIVLENGSFHVAKGKTARNYYMNLGVISSDVEMRVMSGRNRMLGAVEESFITSLQPNEAFIMGGKAVRVKQIHQNTAVVEPAQGENVKTPRWMGNKMALTTQLANEELRLRRQLQEAWQQGQAEACIAMLKENYNVTANVAGRIAQFLAHHTKALPVPTDSPVLAERVTTGRSTLILVHVVGGRAVNRSLAWVSAARIAQGQSVVANFDDHSFLLALDSRMNLTAETLHESFNPQNWLEDLRATLSTTETLGTSFRRIAEIGQLLPKTHSSWRRSRSNGYLEREFTLQNSPRARTRSSVSA